MKYKIDSRCLGKATVYWWYEIQVTTEIFLLILCHSNRATVKLKKKTRKATFVSIDAHGFRWSCWRHWGHVNGSYSLPPSLGICVGHTWDKGWDLLCGLAPKECLFPPHASGWLDSVSASISSQKHNSLGPH